MIIKEWDKLPKEMQLEEIKPYYDSLKAKNTSLFFKRVFDIVVSWFMILFMLPIFLLIAIAIKLDSKGPVFYRQVRVTQYNRKFRIFKFRTMVDKADQIGAEVTSNNDNRVTSVGRFLRKFRLDETAQLFNILIGDMTFVGTRPEAVKYVEQYTNTMMATLLLPAGVTSDASIKYKDEAKLLEDACNADEVYVTQILPAKMKYNLDALMKYDFFNDIGIMFKTLGAIFSKD